MRVEQDCLVEYGEQMKIRGYVAIGTDGNFFFSNSSAGLTNGRTYTFELDVPHPLPELKVDVSTVEEVKEVKSEQKETETQT